MRSLCSARECSVCLTERQALYTFFPKLKTSGNGGRSVDIIQEEANGATCRLRSRFEKRNKATENNYGDGRVRRRTAEYVTKMMNAFWFPFPRFPPRRYLAGAGAHYHKALICQTPEAVCESGVGIWVGTAGARDTEGEPVALGVASSSKDTSIGSFSGGTSISGGVYLAELAI